MKFIHSTMVRYRNLFAFLALITCLVLLSFTYNKDDKKVDVVVLSTDFGDMTILLYDETPLHKENFLKLIKDGFYEDVLFHRVIKNFMIQGGDPESKGADKNKPLGMGGPGYTIPAELNPSYFHKKGALAAARQGDEVNPKKESSGSQFYIVQGAPITRSTLENQRAQRSLIQPQWPFYSEAQIAAYEKQGGTPHLDGNYTVFGEVIDGLSIIDSIAMQPTDRMNRPLKDIKMKMRIERKKLK